MFINYSNHPSDHWSDSQIAAAHKYGKIVDEPFPSVPPEASEQEIQELASICVAKLVDLIKVHKESTRKSAIHIMGEMTLTFAIVQRMKKEGITCLASTTTRLVTFDNDGNKVATFQFMKFRKYE